MISLFATSINVPGAVAILPLALTTPSVNLPQVPNAPRFSSVTCLPAVAEFPAVKCPCCFYHSFQGPKSLDFQDPPITMALWMDFFPHQNHYVLPNIYNRYINSCIITNGVAVSAPAKKTDTLTLFCFISTLMYSVGRRERTWLSFLYLPVLKSSYLGGVWGGRGIAPRKASSHFNVSMAWPICNYNSQRYQFKKTNSLGCANCVSNI